MSPTGWRIGVDLGGTKIEALALSPDRTEHGRRRIPTPRGDIEAIVRAIHGLVSGIEGHLGIHAVVGVGTPGAVSPATGLFKNAANVGLNDSTFHRELEEALGRPVWVANDANCFALSEAIDGAAAGAHVVFGVILGTGTGGGVVVDQRVLTGPNAIAGEWGHNPMPWPDEDEWPGHLCTCGRHGCLETFLAGPGLSRDHLGRTGTNLAPEQIAQAALAGDREAGATLERYARRLAKALATVVNLLDPDVIVLGGGLSNLPALCEEVPRFWAGNSWVFSDRVLTRLVTALHGDSSGVRGAAWLPSAA
jgi:fructokinase